MDEIINVKNLSAKGDGITDDTVAIQNAINNAHSINQPIYIPSGTYIISKTIYIPTNTQVYGDGKTLTVLKANSIMSTILLLNGNKTSGNYYNEISKIGIDGNNVASTGVEFLYTRESILRDCRITRCGIGVKASINSWSNAISSCQVVKNSDTNILLNAQSNDFNIIDCQLDNAGNYGLHINGDCQMVNIMGCVVQTCGKDGILVDGGRALNIESCYLERNNTSLSKGCGDISLNGLASIITGLKISSCEIWTNNVSASILLNKVIGCVIMSCSLDCLSGYKTPYSIQTSSDTRNVVVLGNYITLPYNDVGKVIK